MKILSTISNVACLILLSAALFTSCKQTSDTKTTNTVKDSTNFKLYSKNVQDSFFISVQLPLAYPEQPKKKYPVVVLTDANFYYPMLAPVLQQYEQGGLLPPMILVGIGYKSFQAMDSLRQRDYLYPKAIPSDEMKAPGGGQNFYRFITGELLPYINKNYPTMSTERTLLGHSFGGYFTLYSLLEQLNTKRADFSGFVAASPSLWYNNFYLSRIPEQLKTSAVTDTLSLHLTVGQLEDPKWSVAPVNDLSSMLKTDKRLKFSSTIYTDLDHMDVGLISYIRGLQKIYNK
ncbi:alpha/beta hydrolase [Mucilaginibacter myungsuensis]|uniref:Alpha/beta hydrolase n=1 Tax=Mucilaginibacter myungsuensis TaxID=649104 RepID=A0A929PYP4_9SPHI|nr:alpha/beta hydrolase-fold protein [Mucilaginibacter myungsuensis]MBE9664491.1 alpha/beta hydrolase [Mucilaginibacter myungsuensis]MDN3601364.1 alpha/beta hydrolase-fold protein [Mucilaginibacter myungsuensis]